MSVQGAATLTANILVGRPHYVQLLIVGVDESGPSVYSIDSAGGSIPDLYCATGSESFHVWCPGRSVFQGHDEKDAIALAAKALLASAQRDGASGNGMDLAVITMKDGYVQLTNEEISAVLSNL